MVSNCHTRLSFQFHKGTIRTKNTDAKVKALHRYFNSIKVQLEQVEHCVNSLNSYHFNSIKVQLERITIEEVETPSAFQFHKGTIRTDNILLKDVDAI